MSNNTFLIFSSGGHFVQRIDTVCVIGRKPYDKHVYEIALNLSQQFKIKIKIVY